MKTVHSVFLSVIILFIAGSAYAQVPELIHNPEFRQDAQAVVDSLYNFSAIGAEEELEKWTEQYPGHPFWKLFEGMTFWWTVLSDLNNKDYDEHFFRLMKRADYAASKLLHEQPDHADGLIVKAVANGYIARHYSNRSEWISSLQYARTAFKAFQYLQEIVPDFPDLKLAEGLKLYYSAYLPEAYPVVKTVSWFLPEGDKEKGIAFLNDAAGISIFAGAEALYFLGNININYEHDYEEAADHFEKLYQTYPNNNYYARLLVKSYYKMQRYDNAMQTIDETLQRWSKHNLAFHKVLKEELYFWKGRILLRRDRADAASEFFIKAWHLGSELANSKHRKYYTASSFYAGKALSAMGKKSEAKHYYEAVLDCKTGETFKRLAKEALES